MYILLCDMSYCITLYHVHIIIGCTKLYILLCVVRSWFEDMVFYFAMRYDWKKRLICLRKSSLINHSQEKQPKHKAC